jgi:hypothetical protein
MKGQYLRRGHVREELTNSVTKTRQLMLYREIIAVCSQIHTKHINTVCGQNVEVVNVKPGGTYSDHWYYRIGLYKTKHSVSITNLSAQKPVYLFITAGYQLHEEQEPDATVVLTPIGLNWAASSSHSHELYYLLNTLYPLQRLLMTAIPVPVLYELPPK